MSAPHVELAAGQGALEQIRDSSISGWVYPQGTDLFETVTIQFTFQYRNEVRSIEVEVAANRERSDLHGTRCGFHFKPHQSFLALLPKDTEVEVYTRNGLRLPRAGRGTFESPGLCPNPEQLVKRLASGRSLSAKSGNLYLPIAQRSSEWRSGVLRSIELVADITSASFGIPAMLAYGTLLGSIRDHRLIPHDDDVDLMVPIQASSIEEAVLIWVRILRRYLDKGLRVEIPDDGMHAYVGPDQSPGVDLWPFWILENGTFFHSQGVRHGTLEDFWPTPVQLELTDCWAPKGYESILSQIYGPNFLRPDPSFQYRYSGSKEITRTMWAHNFRIRWNQASCGRSGADA